MDNYEIMGHENIALSIALEAIYRINPKSKITIVYHGEDLYNLHYGQPYEIKDLNISKIFIGEWKPIKNSVKIITNMNIEERIQTFEIFKAKHKLTEKDYSNISHPSAEVAITSILKNGCIVGPNSTIAPYSHIGGFTSINRNATIGHHTEVGEFCSLNPGCNVAGFCRIGHNTLIGMGANILDYVKIGNNCIIGAGAVVTKNVEDNSVAYGVPAKIIRKKKGDG